ncbi:mitochondrial outer membrane protein porin 2 [Andrographis paniculata]|uniref:mitochondrial outer membrane protein porin 2 n=1 Tax=Andrographis paniculata TaxID=175694 RepID=UPI0021E91C3B|nr:mitochondrial outer membrane protein porin 2 [Andrographis paniculata]
MTEHKLTKSAGITLGSPNLRSTVILGDNGDTMKSSCIVSLDKEKRSTLVVYRSTRLSTIEEVFGVGLSYAPNNFRSMKVKLDSHGILGAVLQHEFFNKLLLTLSTEFDTKAMNKTPGVGVTVCLRQPEP